jgi:hypothetical protein
MIRVGRAELVSALPALAVVAVSVIWATDQGGYFPHMWYPGALVLLAVLAIAVAADEHALRALPRVTKTAIGAFAAYAAWSYLSIAWADAPGPAWDAANQTLLYVLVFVLHSRRLASPDTAALVAGVWVAAMTVLAVVVLLKLPGTLGSGPVRFSGGLEAPFGYSNANAAAWLMAVWPALTLAASREIPAWLRGTFAGAIVVLAGTAVLSDSRGALIAAGIVVAVILAVVPGRVRALLTLLPAGVAVAAIAPHLLDLVHGARERPAAVADLGDAAAPVLLAALVVAVVVAVGALAERRRALSGPDLRDARRMVAVVVIGIAVGGAAVGVAAGDPVDRVRDTWGEFKQTGSPRGAAAGEPAGFGGARYDYYRVALDVFREHPVEGIGAGNFAEDYLQRGRVGERPTSPHSLELGALVQGGVIGAVLLAVALVAAFAAALRRLATPGLARAVAAGGLLTCLSWAVQGSADWFWEFPALAVPALGLLALAGAAGLAPATAPARLARPAGAAAIAIGLAVAASLMFPWLAEREMRRAGDTASAAVALERLDRAADLNPLSERPGILAGQVALDFGRIQRAREGFAQALERDPRNHYATLLLGAIASHEGRRAEALRLLRRALQLAPKDTPTLTALDQARRGRVDLEALNRQIADFARQMVQ